MFLISWLPPAKRQWRGPSARTSISLWTWTRSRNLMIHPYKQAKHPPIIIFSALPFTPRQAFLPARLPSQHSRRLRKNLHRKLNRLPAQAGLALVGSLISCRKLDLCRKHSSGLPIKVKRQMSVPFRDGT
ncbi:uncharacterized protein LY89DRAFT_187648 [Mollisia scopiformis]|uniref:Uncharacterized protein n=1 Tax=Mollisia scopiformis TaxID=149040 RepID=A0A194XV66_MOLSC|nr:uncharacterized protein LY89DRAFT_187648 [Mollisia scopiformis]KUJ23602.1 hypothetical protein LY89DRAFT_187648 [Mollisia scopiformis]